MTHMFSVTKIIYSRIFEYLIYKLKKYVYFTPCQLLVLLFIPDEVSILHALNFDYMGSAI